MTNPRDAAIETVARFLCKTAGFDPDGAARGLGFGWEDYRYAAAGLVEAFPVLVAPVMVEAREILAAELTQQRGYFCSPDKLGDTTLCDTETVLRAIARALQASTGAGASEEYMTVTLSRDGLVQSHNAFDADFDDMVRATETIIRVLSERLSNRKFCPYSHGGALKHGDLPQADRLDQGEEPPQ